MDHVAAKILLLIKSLGLGGAERLIADSSSDWDRSRFSYEIAYLLPWKDLLAQRLIQEQIRVYCLGNRQANAIQTDTLAGASEHVAPVASGQASIVTPARSVRAMAMLPQAWARLQKLHCENGYSLIHADLPLAGVLARRLGRKYDIPVIYTEHNLQERYHPVTRWLNRITYGGNDWAIAVSDEVADSIRRAGLAKKTQLVTLQNGIPVEQVRAEASDGAELRRANGITTDTTVVGLVAVMRAQKRLADWLLVAQAVCQQRDTVHFLLVGDGPEMPKVSRLIHELGLTDRVTLPGLRTDGRRWIGAMDIFLMTSGFEGMPVALLEAMAVGVPAVATKVGGVPEVIQSGCDGFLASKGDIGLLSKRVLTLVDQPELRWQMGERASAKISAAYHLRQRVRAIESLYMSAISARQNGYNHAG